MKKFICAALAACMLVAVFAGCGKSSGNRERVLKIANWADYIAVDEEAQINVLEDFRKDYNAKHPDAPIDKIEYVALDTNEDMLTKIEKGKEDFDLACPSDYMIQQMMAKSLLKEIDTTKLNKYRDNLSSFVKDAHADFEGASGKVYSVNYMWGTMGILYNTDKVKNIANGWSVLWDSQYKGKVEIKDSPRDTFAIASIYANETKLENKKNDEGWDDPDTTADESALSYNDYLTQVMNDTSDENIARVKSALKQQKKSVDPQYEVDQGKTRMISGKSWLQLAWSGDAIYCIDEANANNEKNPNGTQVNLAYAIPEIGSNLWFDGWVIPKYAKNTDAAYAFIDYMLTSDAAIKNMDYIGYTSGVYNSDVRTYLQESAAETASEEVNLNYLTGSTSIDRVNIPQYMYPDSSRISSLAIMKDFSSRTDAVIKMWNSVRVNTLAIVLICVLSVIAAAGITVLVIFLVKRKKKQQKTDTNKTKTQGYRPGADKK